MPNTAPPVPPQPESAALMSLPPGLPIPDRVTSTSTPREDLTQQELDGAQVHIYLLFYEDHALLWSTLEQVFVGWDEKRMNRALGYLEEIDAVSINPAPSPNPWTPDDALVSVIPNTHQFPNQLPNQLLPLPWPGSHIHSPQFPQTPGPVPFGFETLVPSAIGDASPPELEDGYFPITKSRAKTPKMGGKTPRGFGSAFGMTRLQDSQPSTGTGGSISVAEWDHSRGLSNGSPSMSIIVPTSPIGAHPPRLITSEGLTNPSLSRSHSFAPAHFASSTSLHTLNTHSLQYFHGHGHAPGATPPETGTPTHTGLGSEVGSEGATPELRPVGGKGLGLGGKIGGEGEKFTLDWKASGAGQVWSGDDRGGGYY